MAEFGDVVEAIFVEVGELVTGPVVSSLPDAETGTILALLLAELS